MSLQHSAGQTALHLLESETDALPGVAALFRLTGVAAAVVVVKVKESDAGRRQHRTETALPAHLRTPRPLISPSKSLPNGVVFCAHYIISKQAHIQPFQPSGGPTALL